MLKYVAATVITIISFLSLFGIFMLPFMESHSLDGWVSIIMCFLVISIQILVITVYFYHKKK